MKRIIYVSAAAPGFEEEDLHSILAVSRERNAVDGITGVMLFHDGAFLQVLEGPEDRLTPCFERIERDPRHSGLIIMLQGEVAEPEFPNWSMGYFRPADLDKDQMRNVVDLQNLAQRTSEISDRRTRSLISSFLKSFRDLRVR